MTFWGLWVLLGWLMHDWFIAQERPLLPQGVHSWAQADRYALAVNFTENQLKFTEARTLYQGSKDARVGVEFPLNAWLSAAIYTISGAESSTLPGIFRWVNWLLSGIGFYALYLMLNRRMKQAWGSFMLMALAGVSPVFMFYAFGFAPDAVSLSFTLLAFAFFLQFTEQGQTRWMIGALLASTLASLVKISSGVFLIALVAGILHALLVRKKQGSGLQAIILVFAGLGAISLIAWYVWNFVYQVNINFYSPVFMSKANPVESFKEWRNIFKGMAKWETGYFSPIQYLFFAGIILQTGIGRWPVLNPFKMSTRSFFLSMSFIGLLCYSVVFGKQLPDHDYYFISTFLAWIGMAVVVYLFRHPYLLQNCLSAFIVPILSISSLVYGFEQFQARQADVYMSGKQEIRNHAEWLMQLKKDQTDAIIPDESKVFVAYEYEPNLSLVYLNRKGMVFNHEEMGRAGGHFQYWLDRVQPDYLLIRNEWIETLEKDQAELKKALLEMKSTNTYTLYKIL